MVSRTARKGPWAPAALLLLLACGKPEHAVSNDTTPIVAAPITSSAQTVTAQTVAPTPEEDNAAVDPDEAAISCAARTTLAPSDVNWQPECAHCGIPAAAVQPLIDAGRAVMVNCSCPPGVLAFQNVSGTATLFVSGDEEWRLLARTTIPFQSVNDATQKSALDAVLKEHAAAFETAAALRVPRDAPMTFAEAQRRIDAGTARVLNCCAPGALAVRAHECTTAVYGRDPEHWTWAGRILVPLSEMDQSENLAKAATLVQVGARSDPPCIVPTEELAGIALPECATCQLPTSAVEPLLRLGRLKHVQELGDVVAYRNTDDSTTLYGKQDFDVRGFITHTATPFAVIDDPAHIAATKELVAKHVPVFTRLDTVFWTTFTPSDFNAGRVRRLYYCPGVEILAQVVDACTTVIIQKQADGSWLPVKLLRLPIWHIDSPQLREQIRARIQCGASDSPRQ